MDSISQFVLGAAVGEVVLGKKLGNKAMLIGGIAGTIPDLDVIASPFMTELQSLTFHRGITHSIFFTIAGGFLFGWLFNRFYNLRNKDRPIAQISVREWSWFFFWCFITHTLLDCFTMYGTQLFAPFSDYRVAFATVAVADLFYTIPFIACLVIASRFRKDDRRRRKWNWIGIGWSCFYLLLTFFNKQYVTSVYKNQLADQNIKYERLLVGPTLLSNFLWTATAEDSGTFESTTFHIGQYSLFDKSPIHFASLKQNIGLLHPSPFTNGDETILSLEWFTNGYFNVIERRDGELQLNDLRFGTLNANSVDEDDYIFRFPVKEKEFGQYELLEVGKGPVEGRRPEMLNKIWERVKGI